MTTVCTWHTLTDWQSESENKQLGRREPEIGDWAPDRGPALPLKLGSRFPVRETEAIRHCKIYFCEAFWSFLVVWGKTLCPAAQLKFWCGLRRECIFVLLLLTSGAQLIVCWVEPRKILVSNCETLQYVDLLSENSFCYDFRHSSFITSSPPTFKGGFSCLSFKCLL